MHLCILPGTVRGRSRAWRARSRVFHPDRGGPVTLDHTRHHVQTAGAALWDMERQAAPKLQFHPVTVPRPPAYRRCTGAVGGLLLRRSPRPRAKGHAGSLESGGRVGPVSRRQNHRGISGEARFPPVHLHGIAVNVSKGGFPQGNPCRAGQAGYAVPGQVELAVSVSLGGPAGMGPLKGGMTIVN